MSRAVADRMTPAAPGSRPQAKAPGWAGAGC